MHHAPQSLPLFVPVRSVAVPSRPLPGHTWGSDVADIAETLVTIAFMRGSTKWVLCTSRPRMWVISARNLSSLRNDRDFVTGGGGGHLDVGGERVSGEDLTVLVEAPLLPRCPHLDLVVKDERPQRGPLPRFRRRAAATRGGIR